MKNRVKKSGKKKWIWVAVIALVAVACILLFVKVKSRKKNVNKTATQQTTVNLSKTDLVESISATGTLESASSKNVSAGVSDITVKKVLVSVGDTVKKGDALVRFDLSDLEDALAEAKENLADTTSSANEEVANAQTQLRDAEENYADSKSGNADSVKKAKASVTTLKKQVASKKKKVSRAKDKQTKASLQQELTQLEEKLEQAQSSYEQAVSSQTSGNRQNKSSVASAQTALKQAKSSRTKQIKEAQKQVDQAQQNLDKCAVTAPMSGTVTSISVEDGDTYSGGTLLKIQDTDSFVITTSVDEYDIDEVEKGQRVVILTDATDEDELEGKVTFVAPSTDSSSDTDSTGSSADGQMSTGSSSSDDGYEVKIKVTSKDDRLKLGMTAKCSIVKKEASDVFAVPYDAVHTENGESYILVKEDGSDTTQKITVTTGLETDYYTEIQSDSLSEGMQVVIPSDKIDTSTEESSGDSSGLGGLTGGNMQGGPGGSRGGNGGGPGGAPGNGGGAAPSK